MTIRLGSLQRDYDFYSSVDPAFHPAPKIVANPSDEQIAGHRKALEEYAARWKVARETGDYSKLLVEGQQPTKFVLGRVSRTTWRAIQDRTILPIDSERHIGFNQVLALLTRLAVRSVPGVDFKLDHAPDPKWDGWKMAPAEIVEILDETNPGIVAEIGLEALRRLDLLQGDNPS